MGPADRGGGGRAAGGRRVKQEPWVRRSQRVIRMVAELHRLGYQNIRIHPYVHPLAYRVLVAPSEVFSSHNGACSVSGLLADEPPTTYSSASGTQYFGWTDAATDNARDLAEKFIARFPEVAGAGQGRDWTYAGWLAELVGFLEQGNRLPFVSEEHFTTKPYSLRALPIIDFDASDDLGRPSLSFALPPPGPVEDDPAELTGEWGPSPTAASFQLASQPNYLGSPAVVTALVIPLFEAVVAQHRGIGSADAVEEACGEIAAAVSSDAGGYTRMPGWHTAEALGAAEMRFLAPEADAKFLEQGLHAITFVAMDHVAAAIAAMLRAFEEDPAAEWERDARPRLDELQQFVVSVLLGTNVVLFSGRTLAEFGWKPVTISDHP